MTQLKIIGMNILIAGLVYAQSDVLVNTYTDSTQRDPQIARDLAGNYVVVWQSQEQKSPGSKGDIYLQLFNSSDEKVGSETRINTTTSGNQEKPALAMNDEGRFIVTWTSNGEADQSFDIRARVFENNQALDDDFLVNTTVDQAQTSPDVAMNSSGESVIVWDSWFQDGSDRGIYAQRVDKNGIKLGEEFQVNSTVTYSQARPAVAYLNDDLFAVTWESWNQDHTTPSGYGVYGQLFQNDGTISGGEFQVNSQVANYQWFSDVAALNDSIFIVVWCSWEQDGDDGGIYLQRFDHQLNKVGAETRVNYQTIFYQWLPRIIRLSDTKFCVVWSSWKQDGSREGVVARFIDDEKNSSSLEIVVNDYKSGYQWEPDAIITADEEVLVVWSSWGDIDKDYEIRAAKVMPVYLQGVLSQNSFQQMAGRSTSAFMVHVLDSTALTGDTYEITFTIPAVDTALVDIKNTATNALLIDDFKIYRGDGYVLMTPAFEGVRVEFMPVFDFKIDQVSSGFARHSGSNLTFKAEPSSVGTQRLAPIDVALIWGDTDILENGQYAQPLDTAMGINGVIDIIVPFKCWNLTDNEPIDLLVVEKPAEANKRWDPLERIVLFTPEKYRKTSTDTHLQFSNSLPAENLIMPATGDTNFAYTVRPLSEEDIFTFQTLAGDIVRLGALTGQEPDGFYLYKNYPNPFNPKTNINYQLPQSANVRLSVYNILGQKVLILVNARQKPGRHQVEFDGSGFASGTYFYVLQVDGHFQSRKMLLLK